MKTCDFSNAKVGDNVFCIINGEGVITNIFYNSTYSILVQFDKINNIYTINGYAFINNIIPSLYYNKFEIKIPEEAYMKPIPDITVDTPMLVWNDIDGYRHKRYFKEWSINNRPICFSDGQTSFSTLGNASEWDNYEIINLSKS